MGNLIENPPAPLTVVPARAAGVLRREKSSPPRRAKLDVRIKTPLGVGRAVSARRESKSVEFKEGFDPSRNDDWCETIKDVIAIANSGGGYILFGIGRTGSPSGWDATSVLSLDPAHITDKIASYANEQFLILN